MGVISIGLGVLAGAGGFRWANRSVSETELVDDVFVQGADSHSLTNPYDDDEPLELRARLAPQQLLALP